MITRKALRASAKARKAGPRFVAVGLEGGKAYLAGKPLAANPYTGTDWAEEWELGWRDQEETLARDAQIAD